ncbi:MAG: hypothetical protein IKQ33_05990 [Clostridia bacterium]|nr:hypothetical protein [Clostridia bacterium]
MAQRIDFDNTVLILIGVGKCKITKNPDGTYKIERDAWFNKTVNASASEEDILDLINKYHSCLCSVVDGEEIVIKKYQDDPLSLDPITMADLVREVDTTEQANGLSGEKSVMEKYNITGDEATDELALKALENENPGKDRYYLEDELNEKVNKEGYKYSTSSDGSLIAEKDETKTTYNTDGLKIAKETTSKDPSSGNTAVVTEEYNPGEDKPKKKTTTETKDGKTIQETTEEYDYPNNETTTTTIKYISDNSILETKTIIVGDGTSAKIKSMTQTEKKYDETTKTKTVDTYDLNPEDTSKVLGFNRTTYDENDKIQSKISIQYDPSTEKPKTSEEIVYDENGNEKTKTNTDFNGDKANVTISQRQSDGSIITTKYVCDVDSNGNALYDTAKQVGEPEVTAPATTTDDSSAATAAAATGTDEEFYNTLTDDEKSQLEKEIAAYAKQKGCSEEEAKKACLAALRAKKNPKANLSKYDGSDANHPKLDKYINPEPFMDSKLTNIKDLLCSNSGANAKKAQAFREYLQNTLAKGPLFNQALTQLTGASRDAYDRLLQDLNIKVETLTDNAKIAEAALKIIDEELVPALIALAEIDEKRKEIGGKLSIKNDEYNAILAREPERKTIDVDEYDETTTPKTKTGTTTIPNPDYVSWLAEKEAKEKEIDDILHNDPIKVGDITVNGLIALDEAGSELKEKCYTILGKETDLEALIKDFNDSYKEKKGSGGARDPGENPGGGGGGGETPTEAPKLPDNTQDQMKYYQDLSISDLSDISTNLSKFAETNKLTIQELLFDENNAEKLVEYLGSLGVFNDELKKLIKEGDPVKTQELIKNIFTGKEANVVGLDSVTKSVIINKLNTLAESNNTTLSDLLTKEDSVSLIRGELSGYSDIVSKLKTISSDNMKSRLSSIYDGDGVDDYSGSTLKTLKDYIDEASNKNNQSVEEYLQTDASVTNMENFGKTSVLLSTIGGLDDKTLIDSLRSMLS